MGLHSGDKPAALLAIYSYDDFDGCFCCPMVELAIARDIVGHQPSRDRTSELRFGRRLAMRIRTPHGRRYRLAQRDKAVAELSKPQVVNDFGVPVEPRTAAQAWLVGADLRSADLRYVDLSRSNLTEADLRGANLSHAALGQANLRDADLRGACLDRADLSWARFDGANLADATMSRSTIVEASFHAANVSGVDFRSATGLTEGCFKGVKVSDQTRWPLGFDPSDPRVGGPLIHRLPHRS